MESITNVVKERYAAAARRAAAGGIATCGCGTEQCCDPITSNLYDEGETNSLPDAAIRASLGCGNPTALATLNPGETVLDLGSGGGIDVILSARRVGPTGRAFGLDMTDEMLALARENARAAGVDNVDFLKGQIERVPLPDQSVDVIISNCVINLSSDKDAALREAFRVLKPGGRFAVSDVVMRGDVPAEVRRSIELWVGCIAGALSEGDYRARLTSAGFVDVELETTRVYDVDDARMLLAESGLSADQMAPLVNGRVTSAFIRAHKPEASSCCGPTCCA